MRQILNCPCCDYVTHFPKALEAHQAFRKHYAKTEPVKAEEPARTVPDKEPEPKIVETVEKKTEKKPRKAEKE